MNEKKCLAWSGMASAVCLLFSNNALADFDFENDVALALRGEPGFTYYGIDLGDRTNYTSTAIAVTYADFTFGATAFYLDRLAFDVYYRLPITKPTNQMIDLDTGNPLDTDVKIERSEFGVAVAYRVTPDIGAFMGWRFANLDANDKDVGVFGNSVTDSFSFDTNGPTLGLNYGWISESKKHNLNLSGGLTYQSGELSLRAGLAGTSGSGDASALGYTLSVKYGYVINDQLDMTLGADAYYTDFGDVNLSSGENVPLEEFTVSGRIGLRYTF